MVPPVAGSPRLVVARSELTQDQSGLLDPFFLSLIATGVLFLVLFGVVWACKRRRRARCKFPKDYQVSVSYVDYYICFTDRTAIDKVSKQLQCVPCLLCVLVRH